MIVARESMKFRVFYHSSIHSLLFNVDEVFGSSLPDLALFTVPLFSSLALDALFSIAFYEFRATTAAETNFD